MLPSSQPPVKREPIATVILRKCREQPLVPIGCTCTVGALWLAKRALQAHDSRLANRMFFWRVGFQAFTVAALLGGAMYYERNTKLNETRDDRLRGVAKERERLWIQELERIEAEAQDRKAKAEDLQRKIAEASATPEQPPDAASSR